jgi:hypothetical protein
LLRLQRGVPAPKKATKAHLGENLSMYYSEEARRPVDRACSRDLWPAPCALGCLEPSSLVTSRAPLPSARS